MVDQLFAQKASVFEDTYAFHFARLYLTLIQDSFRILVQEELTREQINNISENIAQILLSANQKLLDDMIVNWSRHFQDKISNLEDFTLYRKNAEQMILILKSMKTMDKTAISLKNEIQLLQQDAGRLIRVKMRNLSSQCLKLNELLLDAPLAESFSLVHAPICKEEVIKSLLSNPKQSLVVNSIRTKGVFTEEDLKNSFSVEDVDVNQARGISQQQNVILLYNKTYTENDIRRAIPTADDKTQSASMILYGVPAEAEVTNENIRAHIQSLGLGASLK
jgi:hypothetical protein